MARKTRTPVAPEAVQPELPFEPDTTPEAPVEKKARAPKAPITKEGASSLLADAKKLPKVQAGFDKLSEKFTKLTESHQSLKKQISDLKNLNKANYQNGFDRGYEKGYEKGYTLGVKGCKKALAEAVKSVL